MTRLVPCIWLDDQAEEAAAFYTTILPEGKVLSTAQYPTDQDNPSGKPRGSVVTVEIEAGGQRFTLLNGGSAFRPDQTISFFVNVAREEDVDRIVDALAAGGSMPMALGSYPWSRRYAWVADRYGVHWQVMHAPEGMGQTIVPCVMFAGAVAGQAATAMARYAEVLGGRVTLKDTYTGDEGPEGHVKHGRLEIDGAPLVVMDSHVSQDARFSEGLSLQVLCRDQAEVDHLWDALAADGGSHGPCGWLKDRFGLSWQVVPEGFLEMLRSGDTAAKDRAFAAVMEMGKLDIAAIAAAFAGDPEPARQGQDAVAR